jgi:hypothetical protein
MPYDDLPGRGWGKAPIYWPGALFWGGVIVGSIIFWTGMAVLAWKWVTS